MIFMEKRSKRILRSLRKAFPLLLPAAACVFFVIGTGMAQRNTLAEEQANLEKALSRCAVASYARDGVYPESLGDLLSEYNITYDSSRFVVEYVPSGSNLFPSISVIALNSGKGGGR